MTTSAIAHAILRARDATFVELARIAQLDPQRHFRGADLRKVDLGDDDFSAFDFREADFSGADLSRARGLRPEMFVGARYDAATKAPPGLFGPPKPDWASTIGRDDFGVYVIITIPALRGKPVTQRLRWIPPGRFVMGSPPDEPGWSDSESPQHEVTFSHGFWLFDTPCTQALWRAVMGRNPSEFKGPARPVEMVSFDDVQSFLRRLNARVPGLDLCLPSEAQFEYSARAGTTDATYAGPMEIIAGGSAPILDAIAWYLGNSSDTGTHEVAQKQANAWGLYDMLGNVFEWCADHWHHNYENAPSDGSAWLDTGAAGRVIRGGSWGDGAQDVRAAYRSGGDPAYRDVSLGFRCARVQQAAKVIAEGREEQARGAERLAATTSPQRPRSWGGVPGKRGFHGRIQKFFGADAR
jgi:formylglycine-generating enzyme required for sulfatase activity